MTVLRNCTTCCFHRGFIDEVNGEEYGDGCGCYYDGNLKVNTQDFHNNCYRVDFDDDKDSHDCPVWEKGETTKISFCKIFG